jgi:hypothetical protein
MNKAELKDRCSLYERRANHGKALVETLVQQAIRNRRSPLRAMKIGE